MHASRSQSKETAQLTTLSSHSRPDNDQKIAAPSCFSLTPPSGVSPGVSGLDQRPHTSNRHLAHNHPPHRETNSSTRVRGNDCGSHMHPPCRQNRLTENKFHRRHWINGINNQINARQHRLRHADNNDHRNSKRRPYQNSRVNDAHNRPCGDYRSLNQITVRHSFHRSHSTTNMSSANST